MEINNDEKNYKIYCCIKCIYIGSISVNQDKVNAGIRNRIVNTFRNFISFTTLRRESLDKKIKVKVPSNLVHKANELSRRNIMVGVNIDNFDDDTFKNIKINKNYWYLQKRDANGESVNIISISKPKIFGIDEEIVHHKYVNENGVVITFFERGLPNWVSGGKLKERVKNKPVLLKVKKH